MPENNRDGSKLCGGARRLAEVDGQLGNYDESISELEKAWRLDGGAPDDVAAGITSLRGAFRKSGARGYWQEYGKLLKHGLAGGQVEVARPYARLGQKDEAFLWLKKAYTARDSDIIMIGVDPALDSIGSDPRFAELMRRVGLAQ